MLIWFPRLQVATACFSCSPPNLNLLDPYFIFMHMHNNHCHRVTAHLQLYYYYYINFTYFMVGSLVSYSHYPWFRPEQALKTIRYFLRQCLLYRFTHSHTVTSQACFLRGLNPITMKTEDMIHWLTQWIVVSQVVDRSSLSLLLHCPILLGYNQPSNWMLIH